MADLQKRFASVWPQGKVRGWSIKGRIQRRWGTAQTVAQLHDTSPLMRWLTSLLTVVTGGRWPAISRLVGGCMACQVDRQVCSNEIEFA
jgi:hypothetical protein